MEETSILTELDAKTVTVSAPVRGREKPLKVQWAEWPAGLPGSQHFSPNQEASDPSPFSL